MIALKENERLVQAGVMGLRGPDGEIIKNDPFYVIVEVGPGERQDALSPGEKTVCDATIRDMVEQFGQYVRASKRLGGIA